MTRFLMNRRAWVLALLAGTMPLGTVATCDGGPGGGSLFYDRFDDDHYYDDHYYDDGLVVVGGPSYGYHDEVIIVEDYGYDEVYYEEVYYDDYCDPFYFWDCW